MAIGIVTQANVAVTPGVNVELVDALVGRQGCTIQLQADGFAWVKLSGAASKGDGFRIRGWQVVDLSIAFDTTVGNGTDYYEGPINLLWEGGSVERGVDPEPQASANVRVIETN